jgi:hypothetical protein
MLAKRGLVPQNHRNMTVPDLASPRCRVIYRPWQNNIDTVYKYVSIPVPAG